MNGEERVFFEVEIIRSICFYILKEYSGVIFVGSGYLLLESKYFREEG